MRRRILTLVVLGCTVLGAAGCGSDTDSSSNTRADSSEDAGDTAAPGASSDVSTAATKAGGDVGTPVDAFCRRAAQLTAKIQTALADPTTADTDALNVEAAKLSTDAAALVAADPAAAGQVTACVQLITVALAPEAETGNPTTTGVVPVEPADTSVEGFCARADEVAAELAAMTADPGGVDAEAVNAAVTELANEAIAVITANPAQAAAITACIQRLTDAVTP